MAFLGINQFSWVGLRFACWFNDGNSHKLTEKSFMEKPGIEPATPGLQDIGLSPTPRQLPRQKILFMAFLGINQFRLVGLRFVCGFYNGNSQRLTESGFMEKPGIEYATPGLQGIGLSPSPRWFLKIVCGFPGYKRVSPSSFKICVLIFLREYPKAQQKWFYGEAGNQTCHPLVYKT